jgi:hypothetical protein
VPHQRLRADHVVHRPDLQRAKSNPHQRWQSSNDTFECMRIKKNVKRYKALRIQSQLQ